MDCYYQTLVQIRISAFFDDFVCFVALRPKSTAMVMAKVWDQARIELATPGPAVRLASVARHVIDCATRPGLYSTIDN